MIIVPVMYALLTRSGERNKTKKLRKQFHFIENKDKNEA